MERTEVFDDSVSAFIKADEKKAKPKTKAQRAKERREREKINERIPNRPAYDLPKGMKQIIADIAEEHKTTASQVAAYFLANALRSYYAGKLDIEAAKRPTTSPRYEWVLEIPKFDNKSK